MKCELVNNLNQIDRQQVLHLLASSFPLEYNIGLEHFGFFIDQYPDKFYLLIRTKDGLIIGVFCLINRKLDYSGLSLDVTGMSYMAVSSEYRNLGISKKLMAGLFDYSNSNSDLIIGFARKVMDNYWDPFGFLGFTNFGNISVELSHLPLENNSLSIKDLEKNDLPKLASLFEMNYTVTLNSLYRTPALWDFIIKKLAREQRKIESIKTIEGEIVGYLLRSNNTIDEFCINTFFFQKATSLIHSIIKEEVPDAKDVVLQIGLNHPFSKYLRSYYSHSINTRFAWNGGHIIRVTNLAGFFEKISPILEQRLLSAGVNDFHFSLHDVLFKFNNQQLCIEASPIILTSENDQRRYWQKLIFGVQDVRDLFEMPNIDRAVLSIAQIMFPLLCPQVPLQDQF
ncbi:MAG: GNAT family N-acetyltransferase [Bacteroidia bacterium]|nr:GNAT family N-acetyltransferase [Bacteroidia bacterium]